MQAPARRACFDRGGTPTHAGRWNPSDLPVVHAAATLSLAASELFESSDPESLPPGLVSTSVALPNDISVEHVPLDSPPKHRRAHPAPNSPQRIGANWIARARSPALSVPSAIIPHERNDHMSPMHSEFLRIAARHTASFSFEPRMWKSPW